LEFGFIGALYKKYPITPTLSVATNLKIGTFNELLVAGIENSETTGGVVSN
jgi:hypothetical protein